MVDVLRFACYRRSCHESLDQHNTRRRLRRQHAKLKTLQRSLQAGAEGVVSQRDMEKLDASLSLRVPCPGSQEEFAAAIASSTAAASQMNTSSVDDLPGRIPCVAQILEPNAQGDATLFSRLVEAARLAPPAKVRDYRCQEP